MNEDKNTLAIRIKQMRKDLGLTQEELALKLGLKGKSSIANYESGNIIPSDEIKKKMCETFNCTMDYLMGESEFKTTNEMIDIYLKTQYEIDVNNALINSEIFFLNSGLKDEQFIKTQRIIKDILLMETTNEIKGNKLGDLVNSFSGKQKIAIRKAIEHILDYISNQEKYRIVYSNMMNIKLNFDNSEYKSQFYMCPVYGQISAGMPNWAEECIEGRLPIDPNLMGIVDPEECYFLRVNGESMNKVIRNGAYALIRKTDWVENGEIAVVLVNGFDATLKKFTKNGDVIVLEPMSDDPTIQTQIYTKDTPIKIIGKYIGKFEMKK